MINMSLSSYNYEPSLVGNAPIAGNLIPHSWYKAFTTESGRPDNTLISILSEIFYWYRPSRAGGSKFTSDAWQTSYDHFTTKFHYSKETIRRVFVKLEELGVAYRELRVIKSYGQRYNNVLFIHLNHEKLSSLTEPAGSSNKLTDKSEDKNFCASSHKSYTPSPQIVGDHIEGKINLESILIRSDLGKSDFANNANPVHQSYNTEANQETGEGGSKEVFDPEVVRVIALEPQSSPFSPLSSQSVPSSLSSFHDSNTRCEPTTNIRKSLAEFHPLTEEDAEYLKKSSGRPFNLSFINKLILKLSAKYSDLGFYTKPNLLSYLTISLAKEDTKTEVGNLENFNFKPIEGTAEYTNRKKYNYLKSIEHSEQTDTITRIKQKIIGLAGGDDEYAYHIITNTSLPYIPSNNADLNLVIEISSDITQDQIKIITKATKEVLGSQTNLTFKEKEKKPALNKENTSNDSKANLEIKTTNPEAETSSSSPLWQKIRNILKNRFGDKGEALDKSWFSKLDIELQEGTKPTTGSTSTLSNATKTSDEDNRRNQIPNQKNRIKIKCPNSFTKDWIKTNYGTVIEDAMESAIEYATGQLAEVEAEFEYEVAS